MYAYCDNETIRVVLFFYGFGLVRMNLLVSHTLLDIDSEIYYIQKIKWHKIIKTCVYEMYVKAVLCFQATCLLL